MKWNLGVVVAAVALAIAGSYDPAAAQADGRYGVQLRGGTGFGQVETIDGHGGASENGSPGWGVGVWYDVLPFVSLHLGYDQQSFSCADSAWCSHEPRFSSSGATVDGRLVRPRGLIRPWIGAGVGYRSLNTRWTAGGEARELDGDGALALSASAGFDVRAMPRVYVGPALRYTTHDRPVEGGPAERVRLVGADLGLRISF